MTTDIATTGGSLAIRPGQTVWSQEQNAVLRQSGIDNDVTNAEMAAFLHLCQRTQLDPFSRQIYLIGRWDNRQRRKVFTPQTSIDGYRVIAHRVVAEHRTTLGYEDTLWCGKDGQWTDVWLSDEPPAAAKVVVVRNGQRFPAVAKYAEYVQRGKEDKVIGLWGKMPATMTAKCAEALALRMAFPHDLAGVYTAEEMAQADNPQQERHLRPVQQDEPDPWATAKPEQTPAPAMKGRSQPAQDIADAAAKATAPDMVKDLYRQARAESLLAETVKSPARELLELGAYLIARGQELTAPAQAPQPDVVDAVVVEDVQLPSEEDLRVALGSPHADVVSAAHEAMAAQTARDVDHAKAVAAFRAFAAEHGISNTDAEQQAYTALGAPLADVSPAAIWDLLSQLTNAA